MSCDSCCFYFCFPLFNQLHLCPCHPSELAWLKLGVHQGANCRREFGGTNLRWEMPTWPLFRGFWSCCLWSVQRNWSCKKNAAAVFWMCFSYEKDLGSIYMEVLYFWFNETLTQDSTYTTRCFCRNRIEFVVCWKRFPDWHQQRALEEFTKSFVPPRNVQLADGLRFLVLRNAMGVRLDEWVRALELLSMADFNSMWLNLSPLLCRCKGSEWMHTYYVTVNVS